MFYIIVGLCLIGLLAILEGVRENRQIQKESYAFNIPYELKELEGFTISHLSDLQYPRLRVPEEKIILAVKESQPDVIFLTGDTIDRTETVKNTQLPRLLHKLAEIAPVYVVAGNHETSSKQLEEWLDLIHNQPVTFLNNSAETIEVAGKKIAIAGVFDNFTRLDYTYYPQVENADMTLLLAHHPERFKEYLPYFPKDKPLGIFSGHAHGGQFRIPGIGGLLAPDQGLFPKITCGTYFDANYPLATLFVSRGLANSKFPLRINNLPVILTIRLESK